jgi:hypothetical protein
LGISGEFATRFFGPGSALAALKARLRRARRVRRQIRNSPMLLKARRLMADPRYDAYRADVARYWRLHFGLEITPLWHLAFADGTGNDDVRFIPGQVWADDILPFFNENALRPAYLDKNLSDVLLQADRTPVTILKRMHRTYYVGSAPLSRRDAAAHLAEFEGRRFIVKGSRTDNGVGIRLLEVAGGALRVGGQECSLEDIERLYGDDFLVQEMIVQHADMAGVHPASVNTIRVVTLRWREEIRVLMTIARFGVGGRINDNLGTGGIACGIGPDGRLAERAFDIHGNVFAQHPTTGFSFASRLEVPGHARACAFARDLHRQIYHFDIVSWDIAIAPDGEPIFLEVNFRGGCDSYQLVHGAPLFGDLTEEILHAVRDSRTSAGARRRRPS